VWPAQTRCYSLILIFRSKYENGNETAWLTYQSYVARFCTLRSIARGALATLTGAGLLATLAGDANAYAVKRTSRGELVHWEEATVQYAVDPSVARIDANANAATTSAMGSWSGIVGAPELETATLTAESPKEPGFDQKNGIFFKKSGYTPAGRALAITVLTYDNVSGKILDADVIVNGSYAFEVLPPPKLLDESATAPHLSNTDSIDHNREVATDSHEVVYDFHHVIAHELGHSLGMNDEMGRNDALMYRYSAPNDASIREPKRDDIAGLAELYSTQLEARGNGCGSATVAPKKPSGAASHVAMFASLGLLLFLVARARTDRRARIGFVLAAAAATVAFVPTLSGKSGAGVAAAAETQAVGHARAKVLATSTAIENGLFKTSYQLATSICRTASCPKAGHGAAWGGTVGNITQEVGGYYAPINGDEVDVSFAELPNALGPMSKPLVGRLALQNTDVQVNVLTHAR
jgi:hypothetical protein